jgi:hypothetical protein
MVDEAMINIKQLTRISIIRKSNRAAFVEPIRKECRLPNRSAPCTVGPVNEEARAAARVAPQSAPIEDVERGIPKRRRFNASGITSDRMVAIAPSRTRPDTFNVGRIRSHPAGRRYGGPVD